MTQHLLANDLFYCDHLGVSSADEQDILSFSVKHPTGIGLVRYLQFCAFSDEQSGFMRTYMIRYTATNELVGYFSLKAGLISTNEQANEEEISFDTIPGVELANFAVNFNFVKKYSAKDTGIVIFGDFILPIILDAAKTIGINIVYLFALPYKGLIATYEDYGFHRLPKEQEEELHRRLKPTYDDMCIFMYQLLKG